MSSPCLLPALTRSLRRAESLAVLGVGSDLRADDAAGLAAAEHLESLRLPGVHVILAGAAPENCTGEIRRLSPTHLLILDAADMGLPPGSARVLEPNTLGGSAPGTHGLSLSLLIDYLKMDLSLAAVVVGIQPATLEEGAPVSAEVSAAAHEVARAVRDAWSARNAESERENA
jgi:hydrogenase 3 maturation protease